MKTLQKNLSTRPFLAVALCSLTLALNAASSHAAVIWSDNFESYSTGIASANAGPWGVGGGLDGLWYSYTSASGNPPLTGAQASFVIDNQGVGGSKGLTLSANGTGLSYWGAGIITPSTTVTAATGYTLPDLTLSFNLVASGLLWDTAYSVTLLNASGEIKKNFLINNGVNALSFALDTFAVTTPGYNPASLSSSIRFEAYTDGVNANPNYRVTLDNVSLAAVPEPATWALLAFSMTTVMVLRRRRRN